MVETFQITGANGKKLLFLRTVKVDSFGQPVINQVVGVKDIRQGHDLSKAFELAQMVAKKTETTCARFQDKFTNTVELCSSVELHANGQWQTDDGTTFHTQGLSMITLRQEAWLNNFTEPQEEPTFTVDNARAAGTVYYGPKTWTELVDGHFDNGKPVEDKGIIDFSKLGPVTVNPKGEVGANGVYTWKPPKN